VRRRFDRLKALSGVEGLLRRFGTGAQAECRGGPVSDKLPA